MVRIRLRRIGLKGQPSYRIVVTDQRNPRDGRFIENIGHHNPRTEPETNQVNEERALYWLSMGAQPSDAVRRILKHTGTQGRFDRLQAGEALETLLSEAAETVSEVSPQTRFPAPGPGQSRKKAREQAALAAEAIAAEAD